MTILSLKENLKKSTMFNLSLGSKELFHSNFLAFLIETDPKFLRIFGPNNSSSIKVSRESDRIDLKIETDTCIYVIENKFKSSLDQSQLDLYKKKKIKGHKGQEIKYILLSLRELEPFELSLLNGWEVLEYKEVLKSIEKIVKDIENDYLQYVIKDYVYYVRTVIKFYDSIRVTEDNFFQLRKEEINVLEDLRLHDMYFKYRYSVLLSEFIWQMKQKNKDMLFVKGYDVVKIGKDDVCLYHTGMSYSEGFLEIKIPLQVKKEKFLAIGVMLTGRAFKLYIETENPNMSDKIATDLEEKGLWFDFSKLKKYTDLTPILDQSTKAFNSYNKKFLYRKVELNDINKKEILRVLHEYFKYIMDNKKKILSLIV